jgi:trans-aconitate methyltransferase
MSSLTEEQRRAYERQVAEMYDPFAPKYVDAIAPRQGFWSAIAREVRAVTRGKVLDVGCGPGHLTRDLPAEVEVHGIDISPGMIEEAKAGRPDGRWVVGSYHEPLPEGWSGFDLVLAAGCLEFCRDLRGVLARLGAALAGGGRLIVTIALNRDESRAVGARPIHSEHPEVPMYMYSLGAMKHAIRDAGLVAASHRKLHGWTSSDDERTDYVLWDLRQNENP